MNETTPNDSTDKWLSVMVGCYGDFPQFSLRAVESLVSGQDVGQHADLLVGLNACCRETQQRVRHLYDQNQLDTLFETHANINKDPLMRILLERVTTPYFLWLDDDTHFIDPAWPGLLSEFVQQEHRFDAAGHVFFWNAPYDPNDPLWQFLTRKAWFRGNGLGRRDADDTRIFFPTGGATMGRTAFFREHGFPDYAMVKRQEDVVLGELLNQQHGKLINFSEAVMNTIRISDGDRRGSGEAQSDFLECDPSTGASLPRW